MLKSVYIKNYALVDEVEIQFGPGLNILTGETGAGKSILIGAIGTLLGERTSAGVLRPNAAKAIVEGQFELGRAPAVAEFLQERDLGQATEPLIIRREILQNGRSRAFINDTPVNLEDLAACADLLVDLHGQHEHQSLLKTASHLFFLDDFAGLSEMRRELNAIFQQIEKLRHELDALRSKEQTLLERRDFLNFQIQEIERINPQPDEEEDLLAEEKRLAHSAELQESCIRLIDSLYEMEGSVSEHLGVAVQILSSLQNFDSAFKTVQEDVESALISIEETVKFLQSYVSRIEINPERLEAVRSRLAEFSRLKKKYGVPIPAILEKKALLEAELAQIDTLDEQIEALDNKLSSLREEYRTRAVELSTRRQQAVHDLQALIPQLLSEIGMPGTAFRVDLTRDSRPESWLVVDDQAVQAYATGIDRVQFHISANPGQPLRPLAKIASGGEISRIMLALKSAIIHAVQIPVMIFDEIDIGISGRVAEAVGKKLRFLARNYQIICITHLPQIASAGEQHFLVEKHQKDGTTTTTIRPLEAAERERAIAQLLGGETITDAHLSSARDLLQAAAQDE